MKKNCALLLILVLSIFVSSGCQAEPDKAPAKVKTAPAAAKEAAPPGKKKPTPDGCAPDFRALFDHAVVELTGTGDLDVVVITDPLCWHCRLGHKLLGEYPEKYRKLRLLFFPRRSYIGSDMAAWVLEDAAGTDNLKAYVDFAYADLKQPKTQSMIEARMIILAQFVERFPEMIKGTTLSDLFIRLQKGHQEHVEESAMLSGAVHLPGTPVLIAGKAVLMGFGPDPWLTALDEKNFCE